MPNSQYSPAQEASHGAGASPTTDHGSHAVPGQQEQPTLYEFLTRLAQNPEARSDFDADPRAALDQAGFHDMTATDVQHATSLALDYAPVEVVTEYDRSLQSSVENFAASTQHAAVAQLHPAQFDQEVTGLTMMHKAPEQKQDFSHGGDVDHHMAKDVDVNVKEQDSHNLINVHDIGSGNNIGNGVGNVADSGSHAVNDVTHTVNNTVDTGVNVASNAPSGVTDLAGHAPAVGDLAGGLSDPSHLPVVGDVAGNLGGEQPHAMPSHDLPVVGDVAGGLPDPSNLPVAGPVAGPVVDDVASQATHAAAPVAGPVADAAGPALDAAGPVADTAGPALDTASSALPLDHVL